MVFYSPIYPSGRFNLPVYSYTAGKLPRDLGTTAKNDRWIKYLGVPVVHAGFHFHTFAAEYGPLMNCNVLAGELKHR